MGLRYIHILLSKGIFLILVGSLLISCQPRYRPVDNERLTDYLPNRDLADLIQHMIKSAKKEYNLFPSTYVGGSNKNPIKTIECTFYAAGLCLNLEEARNFILPVIDSLMTAINTYPNSNKLLVEFPFPASRLHAFVMFNQKKESHDKALFDFVYPPYIGGIELNHNQLDYLIYNKEKERYETIFKESLEEARQKIALSQPNN